MAANSSDSELYITAYGSFRENSYSSKEALSLQLETSSTQSLNTSRQAPDSLSEHSKTSSSQQSTFSSAHIPMISTPQHPTNIPLASILTPIHHHCQLSKLDPSTIASLTDSIYSIHEDDLQHTSTPKRKFYQIHHDKLIGRDFNLPLPLSEQARLLPLSPLSRLRMNILGYGVRPIKTVPASRIHEEKKKIVPRGSLRV